MINLVTYDVKEISGNGRLKVMPYDKTRMREALVYSGIHRESLDDYVDKASDTQRYYEHKKQYDTDLFPYDDLAADVLKSKYLAPHESGPLYMWDRLARALASVEETKDKQEYWYKEFMGILNDFKFVAGGRVMHGAGRTDVKRHPTLSNCYVIPIEEDSLEGIYKCITESAMVYRTGGGVGTDLSVLRPEGSLVNATIDKSPGATAFMNLFSESTNTVSQAGRRGALMLTLRVDHPDIEKFITIKNDPRRIKVQYANISALLTHEFMNAVINDKDFDLRWSEKVYKKVRAKELWHFIIKSAHASAEPGLIFWDTMKDYHNLEYSNPLSSTNPCGEQPLADYTACNLGNINLLKFVDEDGNFNYSELKKVTTRSTRFMDNVIDYNMNNHALDKIKEAVASDRRIGLGVTGLGDMFVKMKIKYDSDKAINVAEKVFEVIRDTAYKTSIEIAKEKGSFPLFNWEGYSQSKFVQSLPREIQDEIEKNGIRNGTVLTIPPVGTGSIVAQTSSGIEPIFRTSYQRDVRQHDKDETKSYRIVHPLIRVLFGDDNKDDNNLPDYVVTAHDINPYFRVKIQGVIQKYIDSSISSTINLAEDVSAETVADIYIDAYKHGLKGVTVYREGSRDGVLRTEEFVKKKLGDSLENRVNEYIHPRKRSSRSLSGITERIKTSQGYMYTTINEDECGLFEVFSTVGKVGGDPAAQVDGLSRLISLALRSGIDPREIVNQLKGIGGAQPVWDDGMLVLSTVDGMGKILERYLIKKGLIDKPILYKEDGSNSNINTGGKNSNPCPECGTNVDHVSGCIVCYNCGWSKC